MTSRRRSPRRLGLALEPVRDGLAPATALAEIQRRWRDAVGEAIAGHAVPTAERGGVLTISCEASVWAHELDLMGPSIAARLNEIIGREAVVRLRCVTGPRSG